MGRPTTESQVSPQVRLRAPAKVNLRLEVLGRRPDGYHELRSLATAVGLFDGLRFRPAGPGCFELRCDDPTLACDESNLVVRAARLLAERIASHPGARVELEKCIPVGGGLGGGSSDAATALRGLNELWRADLPNNDLARIGARVGSDVPLFFALPTALIEGRGERVTRVGMRWSGCMLLVLGDDPVSTAEVYRAWRPDDSRAGHADEIRRLSEVAEAEPLAGLCLNELQAAVFRVAPAVERMYTQVQRITGRPVCVSGAGSTMFTPFDDLETAQSVEQELAEAGLRTAVVGAGRDALTDRRA